MQLMKVSVGSISGSGFFPGEVRFDTDPFFLKDVSGSFLIGELVPDPQPRLNKNFWD